MWSKADCDSIASRRAISEVAGVARMTCLARAQRMPYRPLEQVLHFVDKGVCPADDMPGRPPRAHIVVAGLGDHNLTIL